MRFVPRVFALDRVLEPAAAVDTSVVLARLHAHRCLAALDSAGGEPRRFSVVAFDPLDGVRAPRSIADARVVLALLEAGAGDAVPGPFHGGFVGAFAYDLGVAGERHVLPRDPWRTPLVVGGLYVDFVVVDERAARAWLVLGAGELDGRPSLDARRARIEHELASAVPRLARARPDGDLVRWTAPQEHRARVERVRESIAAGDFYQANLAHRFTRRMRGDPLDLHLRLRSAHPAPYAAYFAWDEASSCDGDVRRGALLSASPELLLEFDGTQARTRPIKGTIARGSDADEDARNSAALLASAKDRAELAMIVDLERNDLGRVARAGGVRVEGFPRLESYASVHHLSADVVAEVARGVDAFALLEALFPGGSITGAPKLAAMAAIMREEREGRGFFTGSFGCVDLRGHAAFNILIRTLVWRDLGAERGEVSLSVGGGITWSSDPAAEERETLAKGVALLRAIAGDE